MKSKYLKFALLSAIVCFSQVKTVNAQTVAPPCATDQMTEALYLQHPELRQAYIDYVNDLNQKVQQKGERSTTLYTIPMVFHVIHVNGVENVSDANIIAQVARLNTDYRKLNSDITSAPPYFQSIAGDAIIQFKLAKIDPNGNCTNGIDRIYSHKTFDAGERSKLNQWPRDKYFNVWVINTLEVDPGAVGLVLAYATFPSSVNTFGYPSDGVIMRSDQCNGTSRTLTHEAGHWLNLEHTWGSTNNVATACGDDGVNDTPPTKGHFSTCPTLDFVCDNLAVTTTYTFSNVTTSSGTTDPTVAPVVSDSSLTFSSFTATGVSANSSTVNMFGYSGWDTGGVAIDGDTTFALLTGARNPAQYYEFTVSPANNQIGMTLSSIAFNFQRDSAGVRTYVVRSSADSYAANLAASVSPANPLLNIRSGNVFYSKYDTTASITGSKITLSGANYTTMNPITFRIYGYNAESSTGTFGIDNVVVTGSSGDNENINNYMDYSSCIYMFTQNQVDRMRAALESPVAQRSSLWINSNLVATGTDGGTYTNCTPSTDFYADDYMICAGSNITFTPNLLNLTVGAAATYAWSFPGASTTTSALPSPTVTYPTPGMYNVTLTAGSAGATGTTTVTKNLMIYVNDNGVTVPNTYSEGFENSANFYSKWLVKDLDANSMTWWKNGTAAYTGSNSIVMNAYYNYRDDVDQLISPSYNLTFISGASLTFRCAAATKGTIASDINDVLKVYSSIDCGDTWNLRSPTFTGTGTANNNLINNSYHPEEFVPSNSSQWALHTITLPSTICTANTRFKFEYTAGNAGNSIYIDDINITGVLGVDENSIEAANVSIYPNPTNQTATLSYHLTTKGDTKIELVDVLGKKIMEVNNSNQAEGDYDVQISKTDLNLLNGIYFVKFTINNITITKKLIISE